jgi:hypothetical protein
LAQLSEATPLGALTRALAIAVVAAGATLVMLVLRNEAVSDRVVMLLLVVASGGFLSGIMVALPTLWLTANWPVWLRAALCASFAASSFVPATMFAFALQIRLIDRRIEDDLLTGFDPVELGWSLFGAMGLFTPRGLVYLMPWPLAAVFITAFVCFWRWPSQAR